MTISRGKISFVMIGLSTLVFLTAVTLNGYSESMNVDVLAFTENILAIFSVLFMVVGICFAISNLGRRKTHIRGHNFETTHRWIRRSG
jgi:hypothetical protein